MDELLGLVEEATFREMQRVDLVIGHPGYYEITEKGLEWLCLLMRLAPKADDPRFEEALRNARTYTLEEWNAMVEMSGKKKS